MSEQVRYDFSGRVALVTGAAQGIGKALAEALSQAGATVVGWDLQPTDADGPGTTDRVDVTDAEEVAAAARRLMERHGRLDIVINNAGYAGASVPLADYDAAEWRRIVDVNLMGTYHVCRSVVGAMRQTGPGRIVNIASLAGKEGTPNASAYSAAKAGVIALTKSLGKELVGDGILVNALAPAAVETPLLSQMSADHVAIMIGKSPMARLGTVDEVAQAALWLCSDACTFSTGAVFDLSGGRATY